MTTIDPNLRQWATTRDLQYIDAIHEKKGIAGAARAMKVTRGTIQEAIKRLKARAAKQGYSPEHDMNKIVPDGFQLRGTSTLYDEAGKPKLQWVKTTIDAERQEELVRQMIQTMSEDVRGLAPITPAPKSFVKDLLAVFPIGDPHIGLQVWQQECGDAFDLKIAREMTLAAVDRLMQSAPAAETGVILLLGDVFHMNDQTNSTPRSKHQLDVDSRYVKVLKVGIETYRHAILRALQKHKKVVVRCVQGNHDPEAIWALAYTLDAFFDNDKRVEVDLHPSPFWYYRFGKVLIGSTHGDKVTHSKLGGIMAADRSKDWGETTHRYWYTGHVHSQNVTELPGVLCESFRTLAAKDSYANGHGYRAGRDMICIVHHREHGEIERHRVDVGMLK
ncbi:LysR family transcriptional regulator [Pseudoduganella sp. UC29_106]|uniref:helix-turn-helix domain-containing protein n=1 Tax=Pseudoduganella sp. UC29_106 TaxID=3374553 RepID=UPI0037565828